MVSAAATTDVTFDPIALQDALSVIALDGFEAVSELFCFELRLTGDDVHVDPAALIGRSCSVGIACEHGRRTIEGVVRRFEFTGCADEVRYYVAEVVPALWLLTQRVQSRVFEPKRCPDMSIPGIIRKVLNDAGLLGPAVSFAFSKHYALRDFVVQYRESDMDFIARLMEDEGIFYFFEPHDRGQVLVFGDMPVAHQRARGGGRFRFREASGLVQEEEHVVAVRDRHEVRFSEAALKDYDFCKPRHNLCVHQGSERARGLIYSDYPGGFVTRAEGNRYVQLRLEAQTCATRTVELDATIRSVSAGARFTLCEHPDAALNGDYVATRVDYTFRDAQSRERENHDEPNVFHARIHAIAAETPFRPPCRTPRPFVHGSQTAVVVGPRGEEIFTDKYGRVRVQFHWDQTGKLDEHSSCWIRVSQGSAGGQYGMMFLPRIGQEVIVDFEEGDPDRPIITGRVYNGDLMPPYPLPANKTRSVIKTHSTPGGSGTNEIRFEDQKDEEQILLYAQKDLHVRVNRDRIENVDRDRHLTIGRDRIDLLRRDQHCQVGRNAVLHVAGQQCSTVEGNVTERFRESHNEEVGSSFYLKVGVGAVIEAANDITLRVGSNFIRINQEEIVIRGLQVKVNCSGATPGEGRLIEPIDVAGPLQADRAMPGADVMPVASPAALAERTRAVEAVHGRAGRPTIYTAADLADAFDDQVAGSGALIEQWVEGRSFSTSAMLVGSVGMAFMGFAQSFVDVLRLGQGVTEGTLWGCGKDALRLLTAVSGFGAVVGRVSRLFAVSQTAESGNVCVLVSNSRALSRAGWRFHASLEELARGSSLDLAKIRQGGTTWSEWQQVLGYLRRLRVNVKQISRSSDDIRQLVDLARENQRGVLNFAIRFRDGELAHALLAQWRNGALLIEDTNGVVYRGLGELLRAYPRAALYLHEQGGLILIPNSYLLSLEPYAASGAFANLAVEVRRLHAGEER